MSNEMISLSDMLRFFSDPIAQDDMKKRVTGLLGNSFSKPPDWHDLLSVMPEVRDSASNEMINGPMGQVAGLLGSIKGISAMSQMARSKQLWDTINEGGEGYRPDAVRTATRPIIAPTAAGARTHTKGGESIAKINAKIASLDDNLSRITDASAREITEQMIAELRNKLIR